MRLRTRLFLLVAGTVVPLVALAVGLGAILVDHERDTFRKLAIDRNRAFMSAVDAGIRGHVSTLQALAGNSALETGDLRSFHREAVRALGSQPEWENVILTEPGGAEALHGLSPFGAPLPRDPDPASVQRAVAERQPVVGGVTMWRSIGKYGIAVRVPVIEQERVAYVLSAVLATRQLDQLMKAQNLPQEWVSGLVDARGYFIARVPPRSNAEKASAEFLERSGSAPEGWYRGRTVEGRDMFTAHITSPFTRWSLGLAVPTELVYANATRFAIWLTVGTLTTLALALAIAWWMSRRITTPIAALAAAARELGRDGARPPVHGTDGIQELREVERALDSADAAVREREALLQREQDALKAADRAKDEFLAMLGHELRNPLSAITTSSHVLRAAPPESRMHSQAQVIIERQARQMTRLIDDLLDVSRLTMGKVELRPEPFDLAQLARQLVSTWETSGRVTRGRIELSAGDAWVAADRARIEQVITNLLDNANRFTPPAGRIHVRVGTEAGQCVIEVTDEGAGIAPEMLDKVFKPFVQAPQGPDRSAGGLGLGLAVVQRLVELHGGTVEVANEGAGRGARFTVRLPECMPPPERERSVPSIGPRGLRVLVVEDGDDAREMMKAMLELHGYEVHVAADGKSGLEAAERLRPQIALLDIGLPDIDGYEIARRLRAQDRTREIRLVALTGYGQSEDEDAAYAAGFDLHVTKPVEPDGLARALTELVRAGRATAAG
jgi:signal transduction histidine kinase/CheY-like chemotaxis protein